jgi:hypothetical protein
MGDIKESIEKLTGVFVLLKDKGVAKIKVEYSGGGDSGAIDTIYFTDHKDDLLVIDLEEIPDYDKDTVEHIAYKYLNNIEDWWNNDGGYGTFEINIDTMEYEIENNIRFTDVETYSSAGSLLED